jgi:hypothetical protein
MNNFLTLRTLLRMAARRALLAVGLTVALTACAGAGALGMGGDTWQEEVLLHDGRKMVVERSQTYGGRREIGQDLPVKEHTIRFTVPGTSNKLTWTSEYGEGLGRTNFNLLALHIKQDTPYLVVEPNLCLSYNKWGRPNPPYLVFKWEADAWRRVSMGELPTEFSTHNLAGNNTQTHEIRENSRAGGVLPAEYVKVMNARSSQPQYRTILREAMTEEQINSSCQETFSNGKGRALSANWFKLSKSIAECRRTCQVYEYDSNSCPCSKFFKEE